MTCYIGAEVIKGKFISSAGKVSFFSYFIFCLFIYLQLRNIAECELIERRRLLHFTGFLFVILKKPVKPFGTHEYDADLGFCFFCLFFTIVHKLV